MVEAAGQAGDLLLEVGYHLGVRRLLQLARPQAPVGGAAPAALVHTRRGGAALGRYAVGYVMEPTAHRTHPGQTTPPTTHHVTVTPATPHLWHMVGKLSPSTAPCASQALPRSSSSSVASTECTRPAAIRACLQQPPGGGAVPHAVRLPACQPASRLHCGTAPQHRARTYCSGFRRWQWEPGCSRR